jgi:Redoxin
MLALRRFFATLARVTPIAVFGALGSSCASTHVNESRPIATPTPASTADSVPPATRAANAASMRKVKLTDLLGKPLPDVSFDIVTPELFQRIGVSGTKWQPSKALGGVLVLEFFGSPCDQCRTSMEEMVDESFRFEEAGFVLVGIDTPLGASSDEDPPTSSEFGDPIGETVPVATGSTDVLVRLGIVEVPTRIIVDRQGIVRYVHVGPSPVAQQEVASLVGDGPDGSAESGQGIGLGNLGRLAPGGYESKSHATVRVADIHATGDLPVEIIRRIMRQELGRYRLCYEEGLRKNPKLAGRLSGHFTIGKDGTIESDPSVTKSRLADDRVVQCVLNGMRALSFPQPNAGVVNVDFELLFERPN